MRPNRVQQIDMIIFSILFLILVITGIIVAFASCNKPVTDGTKPVLTSYISETSTEETVLEPTIVSETTNYTVETESLAPETSFSEETVETTENTTETTIFTPTPTPKSVSEPVETTSEGVESVLTASKGVNYNINGNRETWYNLNMSGVIQIMRDNGFSEEDYPYWIREDGCKMLGPYIMVAANHSIYPRGTTIHTSLGEGLVCDTGSFIYSYPYGIDIATNW